MHKQILSLSVLILFISFGLFAQSFSLSDHTGIPLVSGATINISGDTGSIIAQKVKISNISGSAKSVKVKKVEISIVPGSSNSFCFAGECYIPSTIISPDAVIIPVGEIDSTFEGDYKPKGFAGTSTIMYVFFNTADPNDTVFVNIAYTGVNLANISENISKKIDFPNVYPNPVTSVANFSWTLPYTDSDARIIIRDLVGAVVKEVEIEAGAGKAGINIRDLRDGVYFYSLMIKGKPFVTRKMIIKQQ